MVKSERCDSLERCLACEAEGVAICGAPIEHTLVPGRRIYPNAESASVLRRRCSPELQYGRPARIATRSVAGVATPLRVGRAPQVSRPFTCHFSPFSPL
jgi:hypothetical protein